MIFLYPLLPLPSVNIHISGHSYDMISSVSFFFLSLALKPMQGVCCTPAPAACTMMGAQNFIFLLLSLCLSSNNSCCTVQYIVSPSQNFVDKYLCDYQFFKVLHLSSYASVRASAIERHTVVCLCVCLSPTYLLARAHAIASKSFYKLLGIISWI